MAGVSFDFRKFDKFVSQINAGAAGPYKPVFTQWGSRYLGWTKQLFNRKKTGAVADGVSWPRLAPSTIEGRRAGKTRVRKKRGRGYRKRAPTRASILFDLGILFAALSLGQPGNLFKYLRDGVRVGFGGAAKHPEGKATIRDIAVFHDQGKGRLPRRQILHKPNKPMVSFMLRTLAKKIKEKGGSL